MVILEQRKGSTATFWPKYESSESTAVEGMLRWHARQASAQGSNEAA